MSAMLEQKALTLRLPSELHRAITELAQGQSLSVNAYIQRQLEDAARVAEEKARYDAYTALGEDAEACDIAYAAAAQAEVMQRDEP